MRKGLSLIAGIVVGLALALSVSSLLHRRVHAQAIHLDGGIAPPPAPHTGGDHVLFDAEAETIAANKPATVLLHLRVEPGFHINSHMPKSGLLIPTKLAVETAPGFDVTSVDFPAGQSYSFASDPGNKLDVYTGDVLLMAHVKAAPGQHTLRGALRYQACDAAACYPPKLLKIEQPFTAR